MIDEGYIKYRCDWQQLPAIASKDIEELNQWRTRLYQLGLIGKYANGIGFGNISQRIPDTSQLIISGTQTGGLAELTVQHYTKVIDYSWQQNRVTCQGLIKASSETLTHAAIYSADSQINAVIHVHHRRLWEALINHLPTTNPHCAYGTPDMAAAIIDLCQQSVAREAKIIIMGGHEEGILVFGKHLQEAGTTLLKHYSVI